MELVKELAIVSEKFKFLEQRNLKLSSGWMSQQSPKIEIPSINLAGSGNENDVYLHEATLARQQQIALLRKLQKQINSIDNDEHVQ